MDCGFCVVCAVVTPGVVFCTKNGIISPMSDGKSGAGSVFMTSLNGFGVGVISWCVMDSSGPIVPSKRSSAVGGGSLSEKR